LISSPAFVLDLFASKGGGRTRIVVGSDKDAGAESSEKRKRRSPEKVPTALKRTRQSLVPRHFQACSGMLKHFEAV